MTITLAIIFIYLAIAALHYYFFYGIATRNIKAFIFLASLFWPITWIWYFIDLFVGVA